MSATIDDLIETTAFELSDGSIIRKTIQKADPEAGIPAATSFVQSFPPDKINVSDEALKNFAEYLILNPAIECKNLEKGFYPDHFEFKAIFAPLNDPERKRTQTITLAGYIDENEETGFRLEFTPELPITDSLKKIFSLGYQRIKKTGIIRLLDENQFEELAKNGKQIDKWESNTIPCRPQG